MDSNELMLNKLIILYILERLDMPISNADLAAIVRDRYMSYLAFQGALDELVSDEYIERKDEKKSHNYVITKAGLDTISFFIKNISVELRDDIDVFLGKTKHRLRDIADSTADYYENGPTDYVVDLKVVERGEELINILLHVSSPAEADTICNNWREGSADVYGYIVKRLLKQQEKKEDE